MKTINRNRYFSWTELEDMGWSLAQRRKLLGDPHAKLGNCKLWEKSCVYNKIRSKEFEKWAVAYYWRAARKACFKADLALYIANNTEEKPIFNINDKVIYEVPPDTEIETPWGIRIVQSKKPIFTKIIEIKRDHTNEIQYLLEYKESIILGNMQSHTYNLSSIGKFLKSATCPNDILKENLCQN